LTAYGGSIGYFASLGLPMPGVLVAATIIIELGGGIALLLGFKTKWVAAVLALFTLATAFIAHLELSDPAQLINFTKNLAIAGHPLRAPSERGGACPRLVGRACHSHFAHLGERQE